MAATTEETVGADAWREVADAPGWFVLLDHATGFRQPRALVSKQDEYFVKAAVRSLFKRDELRVIEAESKRYLTRRPIDSD